MSYIKIYTIVGSTSFIYGDTFIKIRFILSRGIPTSTVQVRNLLNDKYMIFESWVFRELMLKLKKYNLQQQDIDESLSPTKKNQNEEETKRTTSLELTKMTNGEQWFKVKYHWDSISLDAYAIQGLFKAENMIAEYYHDTSTFPKKQLYE